MLAFKSFVARVLGQVPADNAPDTTCNRRLRSFDMPVIAPYDVPPIVAYLEADRLSNLTKHEIKVFLLLMDQPEPWGLTADWIADHLEMRPRKVRSHLRELERKGYALQRASGASDIGTRRNAAWVCDRDHFWADPELLYGEFACI